LSGSVADASYHDRVETRFLRMPGIGLEAYGRYRDDIFLVVSESRYCKIVSDAIGMLASPMYQIELDSSSSEFVSMLDLEVFKIRTGRRDRLAWRPYVKPTARHIALGPDSAHSKLCHMAWPRSEIRRMYDRATFRSDFEKARNDKISRFQWFFLSREALSAALTWAPKIIPCSGVREAPVRIKPVRLFLPFTSRWKGLAGKLKSLDEEWGYIFRRLGFVFRTQIAFCRGDMPLSAGVRFPVDANLDIFREVAQRSKGR